MIRKRLPFARRALAAGLGVMADLPCRQGRASLRPTRRNSAPTRPFGSPGAAYRFFDQRTIKHPQPSGPPQPGDLAWAERLAAADGTRTRLKRRLSKRLAAAAAGRLAQAVAAVPRVPALPAAVADSPNCCACATCALAPWHGGFCHRALQT